jgi:hypothetical protein
MRLGGACLCATIAILGAGLPATAFAEPPVQPAAKATSDEENKPARPPLPPEAPRKPLPWEEHLEVGGGVAISAVLSSRDADHNPTSVRLKPDAGFHIRLSWQAIPYLWFTGYLVESRHPLDLPAGSLGVPGRLTGDAAWMYTFGARLSPTLPIGSRVRLWLTAGAGWGRVEYPRLCPKQPCTGTLLVRERAASVVEIPLGIGAAFEIIPRWLRIHLELTGSLLPSQQGEALEHGQTIDAAGKMRDVGPMPWLDGTITQTIGLSLVL